MDFYLFVQISDYFDLKDGDAFTAKPFIISELFQRMLLESNQNNFELIFNDPTFVRQPHQQLLVDTSILELARADVGAKLANLDFLLGLGLRQVLQLPEFDAEFAKEIHDRYHFVVG